MLDQFRLMEMKCFYNRKVPASQAIQLPRKAINLLPVYYPRFRAASIL